MTRAAQVVTACILVLWTCVGIAYVVGHERAASERTISARDACVRTLELSSCRKAGLAP